MTHRWTVLLGKPELERLAKGQPLTMRLGEDQEVIVRLSRIALGYISEKDKDVKDFLRKLTGDE